ncbi:MAG: hypothetical protein HYY51_02380 [Candidatus Magasanikbacteria bacterium]|nr:hypothetical protein [Candidatus Magasanikbacteria bacterium]
MIRILWVLLFSAFCLLQVSDSVHAKKTIGDAEGALTTVVGKTGITEGQITNVTGNIIKTATIAVGIIFFIIMVYAGIRWMTARGEEENVKTARDSIIRATIGLVIVVAAYAVTSFVTNRVIQGNPNEGGGKAFLTPDQIGDQPLGCCFDWYSAGGSGDYSVWSPSKIAWRVTTLEDCKLHGEKKGNGDELACPGPTDGCWQFYQGLNSVQCQEKWDSL